MRSDTSMFDSTSVWWPLALSEEVTSRKPLAVQISEQPIVLWRDKQGIARALEDRCPHRRAPLSLGCVRDNGWLQCGYHGWSFDGATGKVQEIPNLKDQPRFPPVYRAESFAVHESGGFVRVCLNAGVAPPATDTTVWSYSGRVNVALDHARYVRALLDAPDLVLHIPGVRCTPYLMSDLHEKDGTWVMERNADWLKPRAPAAFRSDYPLALRIAVAPAASQIELVLRDVDLNPLMHATLAPAPAARGTTAVRWRGRMADRRYGLRHSLFAVHSRVAGGPALPRAMIDGAALMNLKPSVSLQYDQLLTQLEAGTRTAA